MILRAYNHAEFTIHEIQRDNEFKTLMNEIKDDIGIHMNIPPAEEKVGAAEQNNRTIGERVWATYHHVPYKAIPCIMLKYFGFYSTAKPISSQRWCVTLLQPARNIEEERY